MEYLFTKTPLAFFTMDLWRDEAFSFVMARQNILDILRTSAQDFAPPFYYIILHYWMLLFGRSEIALRSLSFLMYAFLLFVIFEIMTLVFKIAMKRALLYFLLMILNPFLNYYAFEARMYMMVAFLVTLSYFALWNNKKKLYIVSITLALYTHYFAVFIFIAQMIGMVKIAKMRKILKQVQHKNTRLMSTIKHLLATSYQLLIPSFLLLPWIVYVVLTHDFSHTTFWIIQPMLSDLFHMPFMLFTGYERVFGEYYHGAAGYIPFHTNINMMLGALLLVPVVILKTTKPNSKLLTPHYVPHLYLWAFLPALMLFFLSFITTPIYLPRYAIGSVPGLLLLIVVSFELLGGLIKKYKAWISLALLGILLYVTQVYNTLNITYHAKRSISSLYTEIQAVRTPQDVIYVTNELDFHLAQYYAHTNVFIFGKNYDEIPQYVGKSLISKKYIRQSLPRYPMKAFIVHSDWYEVQALL